MARRRRKIQAVSLHAVAILFQFGRACDESWPEVGGHAARPKRDQRRSGLAEAGRMGSGAKG